MFQVGRTPLICADLEGYLEMVNALLVEGGDIWTRKKAALMPGTLSLLCCFTQI